MSGIQVRKDIMRRILFELYERERQLLKKQRGDLSISSTERMLAQQKLSKLPGLNVEIKNRCVLTGRGKGIYRSYRLSRIKIKELASYGKLPGIRKGNA